MPDCRRCLNRVAVDSMRVGCDAHDAQVDYDPPLGWTMWPWFFWPGGVVACDRFEDRTAFEIELAAADAARNAAVQEDRES